MDNAANSSITAFAYGTGGYCAAVSAHLGRHQDYLLMGTEMGHKPIITPAKALEYARKEAQRRWGVKGWAWHPHYAFKGGESYCVVGVKEHGENEHQWTVYGIGKDFSEAFNDAVERGN